MLNNFGKCSICNVDLEPVYFEEKERKLYEGAYIETGRVRTAVDYLLCPCCGERFIVDDSFDSAWVPKTYKR